MAGWGFVWIKHKYLTQPILVGGGARANLGKNISIVKTQLSYYNSEIQRLTGHFVLIIIKISISKIQLKKKLFSE